MYTPTVINNTLPVLSGFSNLLDSIFNHSSKIKQIDMQYKLARKEMDYSYRIERQRLVQDLQKFETMAQLTKQQFEAGHIERMELLKNIKVITKSMSKLQDATTIKTFKETIDLLLGTYQKSIGQVSMLESTKNKMIGAI